MVDLQTAEYNLLDVLLTFKNQSSILQFLLSIIIACMPKPI